MNALEVTNLTHKFGVTKVLKDINLSLKQGETLALVGPSGCGKSTLLQCIAGLLTPSEGQVNLHSQTLAYMFQEPRLLPWKNTRDNLSLGIKAQGLSRKECQQQALAMALTLGLSAEDLYKFPHELSGGMQSRVALGRALLVKPTLLLLDEPFSALDIGLKMELYQLLRQHISQLQSSVLMITHDLMEAVRLADRVLMMVPEPGRFIGEFVFNTPHSERSDAYIYQTTAELMQDSRVKEGFNLA
ncbi:MAG: ATP-binding cassette domain-containing protein [Venatoribacter sp.]